MSIQYSDANELVAKQAVREQEQLLAIQMPVATKSGVFRMLTYLGPLIASQIVLGIGLATSKDIGMTWYIAAGLALTLTACLLQAFQISVLEKKVSALSELALAKQDAQHQIR